jgi:competence protein ComGD
MEKNEEGFTLIEVLIVLGCLTLMLAVVNTITYKMFETYEQKAFLNQLEKDIYYAQLYAIENRKYILIRFMTDENEYSAYSYSTSKHIITTRKAESIQFKKVGNVTVTYIPSGNIQSPVTITLTDKKGKAIYRLVFQLGRGRFYISKI